MSSCVLPEPDLESIVTVVKKRYQKYKKEATKLVDALLHSSPKTLEREDIEDVISGTHINIDNVGAIVIRHGVSVANLQQEMGHNISRFTTKDPSLYVDRNILKFAYLPQKIVDFVKKKAQGKKHIHVAVSELKRTWMTAIVVAKRCEGESVTLHVYKALNEKDAYIPTRDNQAELWQCAVAKTTRFAEMLGMNVHWGEQNTQDLRWDTIVKDHNVLVSSGGIMRQYVPKLDRTLGKTRGSILKMRKPKSVLKKLMGNYAVIGYIPSERSEEAFKMLAPGIPKMTPSEYGVDPSNVTSEAPCNTRTEVPSTYPMRFNDMCVASNSPVASDSPAASKSTANAERMVRELLSFN